MGQYFKIVNHDKKEYLHPHAFGNGLKLGEIAASRGCSTALILLCSSEEGEEIFGRWSGDRIEVAGDYTSEVYEKLEEEFTDISSLVIEKMCKSEWLREMLMPNLKLAARINPESEGIYRRLVENYGE